MKVVLPRAAHNVLHTKYIKRIILTGYGVEGHRQPVGGSAIGTKDFIVYFSISHSCGIL